MDDPPTRSIFLATPFFSQAFSFFKGVSGTARSTARGTAAAGAGEGRVSPAPASSAAVHGDDEPRASKIVGEILVLGLSRIQVWFSVASTNISRSDGDGPVIYSCVKLGEFNYLPLLNTLRFAVIFFSSFEEVVS